MQGIRSVEGMQDRGVTCFERDGRIGFPKMYRLICLISVSCRPQAGAQILHKSKLLFIQSPLVRSGSKQLHICIHISCSHSN
jgi:hypothetical protein